MDENLSYMNGFRLSKLKIFVYLPYEIFRTNQEFFVNSMILPLKSVCICVESGI